MPADEPSPAPFIALVRRGRGVTLEPCLAECLDAARRQMVTLARSDRTITAITVLDGATRTPLGSVDCATTDWTPAPVYPPRRMTWH